MTLRQVGRQRRMLVLLVLALVPVLISILYRFTADNSSERDAIEFASGMLATFVVPIVLPLAALLVGTSALGQDIEEGTIAYLLAKPLARWKVVVAKMLSAWLLTYLVTLVAVLGSGLIVLTGHEGISLVPAFVVACAAGALAYVAIFIALSLRFSRALIIGLGYVFVWEAIISQFIAGVRFLSIRAYTVGIADALTDVDAEILTRSLDVTPAIVLLVLLVALGGWYATRAVTRFQISERV
ncbi:MAG: ABC transporter permease subunit [Chloroflexi bacterium]|nr:ABC transporter permease subunit [Chloroflexota bacterium]